MFKLTPPKLGMAGLGIHAVGSCKFTDTTAFDSVMLSPYSGTQPSQ